MIANLKPYPETKECGLPWLGQVPGHWQVRQARHIGRVLKGVGGTREDAVHEGVPCVRYGELYTTYTYFIYANKGFVRADRAVDYTPIHYGDVLFAASGETIEEIGKSAVNLMAAAAVCGGDVIILRPSIPVHAPFLGYAMDCRPAANQKATMGRGTTVKHIYPDELRTLVVPLPPPDEQAAIVRFLDWANGRLERTIRAKRKVIALLSEQKQAIIHRAVTRGLDPSVPLKRSGIPWLREIPQHWSCVAIKRLLSRMDYGTSEASTEAGSIRILTMGNIQKGEVVMPRSGGLDYVPDPLLLDNHDLLFTRTNGNPNLVGKVGIFRGQASDRVSFASYLVRLRVKREYEPQWLHMLLNSSAFWPFARSHALVNLQTNLNSTRYGQFLVPVPPGGEQAKIVAWIAQESKSLNTAISRLEREIELLREYRTRLVADVVTGKLDVREAAGKLHSMPDEAVQGPDAMSDAPDDVDAEGLLSDV